MLLEVFREVIVAWRVRHGRRTLEAALPPVATHRAFGESHLAPYVRRIRLSVACLLFFKPDRCFYRAFATAVMLRRRGWCVTLNLGCKTASTMPGGFSGHCWASLGGTPLGEINDPRASYPIRMGTYKSLLHYWLGGSEGPTTPSSP